jgi:hypothetical protein
MVIPDYGTALIAGGVMFICCASHNTEVTEPLPQFRTNYFVSKPPESVQSCGFRPGTSIGNDIPKFGTN